MYTKLYKIASKYYFKTYFNGARTRLEPATYRSRVRRLANRTTRTDLYIYTYTPHTHIYSVDGKPWAQLLRRHSSNLNWTPERTNTLNGFYESRPSGGGNSSSDGWIGIANLARVMTLGTFQLYVEMYTKDGNKHTIRADSFRVLDAANNYKMSVEEITATGKANPDDLKKHHDQKFKISANTQDKCGQYASWWIQLKNNKCYGILPIGADDILTMSTKKITKIRIMFKRKSYTCDRKICENGGYIFIYK